MNERERILDLVKQGVITSEEALVLLENMAQTTSHEAKQSEGEPKTAQQEARAADDPDEAALAAVNTKIAALTGTLDAMTTQAQKLSDQLAANEEQVIVLDTMEDLDTLTEEKYQKRAQLKQDDQKLNARLRDVKAQQADLKQQLAALNREKRDLTKHRFTAKVLPDDWQDQAKDAVNDLGKTVGDATSQIGSLMKQTMNSVMDNIDWKDVNIRVPGLATERFDHTFDYPECAASVLDIKVANGDVTLQTWDQAGIRVQAAIKLYGKMDEAEPLDAFMARSRIEANDDHFVFQVPNKRVQADLVISLPKREYDHTSVRLLNGNIKVTGLNGKDFYTKTSNGEQTFADLTAVMLEAEGVNGAIKVDRGTVHDVILQTINGDIKVLGEPQTLALSTVNGTVRATLYSDFHTLKASSVNGNVKLALPVSVALQGDARTHFGSVKSRMAGVEVPANGKAISFDRVGTGTSRLDISTTSGNVQLKDVDPLK